MSEHRRAARRSRRPSRRRVIAVLALIGLAGPPAYAEEPLAEKPHAGENLRLVLATATPGGGFPAYGEALAAAIREVNPDITLDLRASKGSTENLDLLRSGQVDLGLVQGEYAYEALAGQGAAPAITVVAPVYAAPGLFVVPADGPVAAFTDLRGRPVALGTRSSGLTAMGRTILRGAGLDPEQASARSSSTMPETVRRCSATGAPRRCSAAAPAGRASGRSRGPRAGPASSVRRPARFRRSWPRARPCAA